MLLRKPEMSSFYFQWILLSALWIAGSQMHIINHRSYAISAGLAFMIECNEEREMQNASVSWSLVPNRSLDNINGININVNVLWFLPADLSHSGSYSCLSRKGNETWETIFEVCVENKTCPKLNRKDEVTSTKELFCFLPHIFEIDPQAQVTWRNNCHPLNVTNSKVFPINRDQDKVGLYTCFVSFTFEGKNYSAAQTTEIYKHSSDYVVTKPKIIYPKEEIQKVTLGESYTIKCKALAGKNDNGETFIYWLSDSESLDLNYDFSIVEEGDQKYMLSVLNITEVTEEYLYINFTCVVLHPAGSDFGKVFLIPASQNERYFWIGLGLVALLILLCAVVFLFRVDLVLAYRAVCSSAAVSSDGKLYDAYVCCLHGDQHCSSSATKFALDFLPAVLEDLYGYKLFISGRDELPGEAVHEVIADIMSRSRRLIIVLTSQSCVSPQTDATKSLLPDKLPISDHDVQLKETTTSSDQIWAAYEQRVGLYDALVKQGLKVILVQVEDGVEEALLPESLQYISRTKGILKWRPNASERVNKSFWKYMRYRMPPAKRQKNQELTVL
ncbi:interleukin-1 receptor-like 2 isoform X1 [Cyprinus carpio]|uniref:Interleukin-1 receptor-like 2 isoform X1 n=2 Tax=Cyprinus carpio TaxID=7962 RepID=A0A9Q9YHH7_CYPCA|nr:interleukin-1 receptor-like 2 isoform X1 [Cyprinus carpio]XP_042620298.1 interleukin-1 receptor-like 2 isoform X1 [Cyprinus carpio]